MSCLHKFHQHLNLQNLNFEPSTLIVGTFNPCWDNIDNNAEWFYGRTLDANGNVNNNFWDVLPKLYDQPSLIEENHKYWKEFCSKYKIAITDIISNIEDADQANQHHQLLLGSYSDESISTNFYDFDLTNIVRILRTNTEISNVYITRDISQSFWKSKLSDLKRYCSQNQISLKSIITPSKNARYQQGIYNNMNPQNPLSLADYILMRWQNEWHNIE